MNTTIYSKEDKEKLTHELAIFSNGFVFFFVAKLILTIFELCSLNVWLYGGIILLLIYWCIKVFRKLETSNKVLFCITYGILLILIFLSYKVSPICS